MPYSQLVTPRGHSISRTVRILRAAWRDTSALWSEFRRPIIAFLVATIGGGYLYGELLALAGYARVPFIDLPYMMVQLMVLETPGDPPHEPYLIVFWYLLPLVAIYIAGRGAVDFVRLFFNREERRSAWEEAVASTYRNHVIIMGVGHVGLRVARALSQMGFEVVAIELQLAPETDAELSTLGIPVIVADGRHSLTLETAGLRYARSFVACTASDQANLEAIMRARDMNPDIRIVSRIWDSQFAQQMKRFMGVEAVMSASDLAAPAFAGAAVGIEITQTLHISGVDYSMIRLTVLPGSFLDGATVDSLQDGHDIDIVLHGNNDDVDVHPQGETLVRAGDTLVIFARHDKITSIVARNQRRNGS